MTIANRREKFTYFLFGIFSVLVWLLLTGNSGIGPVGRYQMEAVVRNDITHVYVIDTTSGVVKWVDKMNTPFDKMKGE